jgi:hypothetical protein
MKNILALYNRTPNAVAPHLERGDVVYSWDLQGDEPGDVLEIDSMGYCIENFETIDGIFAFPPCDKFTVSVNRLWEQFDESGETEQALELVDRVFQIVDAFRPTDPEAAEEIPFFWVMENPVGRLNKLRPGLGDPFIFHPWEYAGYLNPGPAELKEIERIRKKDGIGIKKDEALFLLDWNVYTKKTCLYGEFNREIPKKPIPPVKGSKYGSPLLWFGGKSKERKQVRSVSPEGFFRAFYRANINHCITL